MYLSADILNFNECLTEKGLTLAWPSRCHNSINVSWSRNTCDYCLVVWPIPCHGSGFWFKLCSFLFCRFYPCVSSSDLHFLYLSFFFVYSDHACLSVFFLCSCLVFQVFLGCPLDFSLFFRLLIWIFSLLDLFSPGLHQLPSVICVALPVLVPLPVSLLSVYSCRAFCF